MGKQAPNLFFILTLAIGLLISTTNLHAGGFATVTNGNDADEGSLRHALEVLKASNIIIAPNVKNIHVLSTLTYIQPTALTILGHGSTLSAAGNFTILAVTNGADVTASNLSLQGREVSISTGAAILDSLRGKAYSSTYAMIKPVWCN